MTGSAAGDWRSIGCAALLGASIAFPVGLMVGGGGAPSREVAESRRAGPVGTDSRTARNPYSPNIGGDPYVIAEQLKVVEALESSCRQSRQLCTEAEQARRRIEEAGAGR